MIYAFRGEPYNHTYENEAFDTLLEHLETVWGDTEEEYYLFGNVMCNGREFDAAFLKRNALTIIDFKNYGGHVTFSENNLWHADGQPVKGGTHINPFRQMRENKFDGIIKRMDAIGELPSKRSQAYGHISGLVVFHAKPIVFDETSVPRKINSWFKVTDLERAVTKLDQIGSADINFSPRDMHFISESLDVPAYVPVRAKLKAATPAKATMASAEPAPAEPLAPLSEKRQRRTATPSAPPAQTEGATPAPTPPAPSLSRATADTWPAREDWRAAIQDFLSSNDRLLVLTGTHGTNIDKAVADAVDASKQVRRTRKVLAPNRRLADAYVEHEASSVYSYIYGGNAKADGNQLIYPLTENDDADEHVYVITDAHLVSDSHYETDLFRFGSGRLLTDLLGYASLDTSRRQVIFVGDPWQLTRGDAEDAATVVEQVASISGHEVRHLQVTAVAPERTGNPLVKNAQALVRSLEAQRFNHLLIEPGELACVMASDDATTRREDICSAFTNNPFETKFIAYMHNVVNSFNTWIRKAAFGRTGPMKAGDVMHLFNGFAFQDEAGMEENILVPSGSFLEILDVLDTTRIEQPLMGRGAPIRLDFIEVRARVLDSYQDVQFHSLRDFTYADRPEVDTDVGIALRANAEKRFQELVKTRQFSSDPDTAERQKAKLRADFMRYDPYLNAAHLRFGYALTLHRAQGMKFPTVFINFETGQGQENESYFRWAYTGLTIPDEKLICIKPPNITPLYKAHWQVPKQASSDVRPKNLIAYDPDANIEPDSTFPSAALQNLYRHVSTKAAAQGMAVTVKARHNYQELYRVVNGAGHSCTVRLNYNGKHQVTRIESVETSSAEFYEQVSSVLTEPAIPQVGFSAELYQCLHQPLIDAGFDVTAIEHHSFQDVYFLKSDVGSLKLQLYYDGDGFVTRVTPAAFTNEEVLPDAKRALGVLA
jgi:hypothetical protein